MTTENPTSSSAELTPAQAAERCQVSIRTLRRWLAAGELEGARKDEDGYWHIPPDALMGRLPKSKPPPEPTAPKPPSVADEVAALRAELALAKSQARAAEELADALRDNLADVRRALRQLTAGTEPVVTDGTEPVVGAPVPVPMSAPSGPRRWWQRAR